MGEAVNALETSGEVKHAKSTSTAGLGWQAEKDVSLAGPTLERRYLETK